MESLDEISKKLLSILGAENFIGPKAAQSRFFHIWKPDEPLKTRGVLLPTSTYQVSEIMKILYANEEEVIVHGGVTNLVGATQTKESQWVLSLEKMNRIEEIDTQCRTVTVEAGCILENVIEASKEQQLLFPVNFGARGSAQIGGIISTNAGGLRVFRYGMTRQIVLGLEVVLPNGKIISNLKKIIKDNSGYDLKHLFIGSEGTLGVVTKAVFRLYELPSSRVSALVGIENYANVVKLLKFLDKNLGGSMVGFELVWNTTYHAMIDDENSTAPLPSDYPYYVFVDCLGTDSNADLELLQKNIEAALEDELIVDGIVVQSERELQKVWKIREDVSILDEKSDYSQHFDISLPISVMGDVVEHIVEELHNEPLVETVFPFGHIADGNIHFIIGKSVNSEVLKNKINDIVYSRLQQLGGSVSAEHGIGLDKKAYLNISKTETEIELMQQIKTLLDPKAILNPKRII